MSELEGVAAPVLRPLILGDETRVSPDEQELVALWFWKTFLMIELMKRPTPRVTTDEDYAEFYQRSAMPPSAHVWIAGCIPSGERSWFSRYLSNPSHRFTDPTDPLPAQADMSGYRATLMLGRIAFQLVADRDGDPRGFIGAGAQDGLIWLVYPGFVGPALPWPPPLVLDGRGFLRFHNRNIGREIVSPARPSPLALPPVE